MDASSFKFSLFGIEFAASHSVCVCFLMAWRGYFDGFFKHEKHDSSDVDSDESLRELHLLLCQQCRLQRCFQVFQRKE